MIRLTLSLAESADWLRHFDPRGGAIFVPMDQPPEVGAEVRVDLHIVEGGPRVILKGSVLQRRVGSGTAEDAPAPGDGAQGGEGPPGCSVGLTIDNREKINFLNGYVRGGLINRRELRRLPLRLPVTYGGLEGPVRSFSRDLNDEGIFVLSEAPLPEGTKLHLALAVPGRAAALPLKGTVQHTVIVEDEDVPGMGIKFALTQPEQAELTRVVDELERAFFASALPEEIID